MEKLWKEIPDTDGKCLVSTAGEVMAISRRVKFGLEWCDYSYNANYGTGIERSKEKRLGDRFVVINLDTGEVYQTPKDASRATGIHNDSISRVCKGKSKTAGGYRWRYLNE